MEEMIERVEARQVRRLTGVLPPDAGDSTLTLGNVVGTDLGHMFDMHGQLYMVFGDTYGVGSKLPPGPEVPANKLCFWRSNAMAVVPDGTALPEVGLHGATMVTDYPGHAKELLPGAHQRNDGTGEVTKIPTNGIAIDGRMFLHFMSVTRWVEDGVWATNHSKLAYSDDGGHTWTIADGVTWGPDSNFAQVAFARHGDAVYLCGIPAGRGGGVKLARVPADRDELLRADAYRYHRAGEPGWVVSERDATVLVPGPVGELSVLHNEYLGRWTMLHIHRHFRGGPDAIVVREAPQLTGPWSAPRLVCTGGYGSFMHPQLVRDRGRVVLFTMSRWNAPPGDDHPYNVYLMEARFTRKPLPVAHPLDRADPVLRHVFRIDPSLRGVLLAAGWRTEAALATMSREDQRNTLIVELSGHTKQPVTHFQGFDDAALVGKGAVVVVLRDTGIRSVAALRTMTDDDQRNTLIVENAHRTGTPVPSLQGLTDFELVRKALTWYPAPA